jgi:hypothetical protein
MVVTPRNCASLMHGQDLVMVDGDHPITHGLNDLQDVGERKTALPLRPKKPMISLRSMLKLAP